MGCSRVCSDSAESVTADVHVHHTWLVVVVARTRRERRDVESFCERGGDVMFSRTVDGVRHGSRTCVAGLAVVWLWRVSLVCSKFIRVGMIRSVYL